MKHALISGDLIKPLALTAASVIGEREDGYLFLHFFIGNMVETVFYNWDNLSFLKSSWFQPSYQSRDSDIIKGLEIAKWLRVLNLMDEDDSMIILSWVAMDRES